MSSINARGKHAGNRSVAVVLWNGDVGGAEVFSVLLSSHMRRLGIDVTVVFVEQPQPIAERLAKFALPYRSLGLRRGRDVLLHPRRYAAEITRAGPDGALLVECGFMGAALRAGGYRGPIVATEQGAVLEARHYSQRQLLPWRIARAAGGWADDVEVAVSHSILERLRTYPHARELRMIHNGIDLSQYALADQRPTSNGNDECTVAFAGRLVHGKGPDYLIEAIGLLRSTRSLTLLIAGDGPERARLEFLARAIGAGDVVEFLGLTHDIPAFWQRADVAVVPSAEFIEGCPVAALEAMAAGKPLVATRNGGLPEIVLDGETGMLVSPCDAAALAEALGVYAGDPKLRLAHGARGKARVSEHFNVAYCAQAYIDLFTEFASR